MQVERIQNKSDSPETAQQEQIVKPGKRSIINLEPPELPLFLGKGFIKGECLTSANYS